MSWNYRVIKEGNTYSIRSVYYDKKKPHSWQAEYEELVAESVEELIEYLDLYTQALERPVLEVEKGIDKLKEI